MKTDDSWLGRSFWCRWKRKLLQNGQKQSKNPHKVQQKLVKTVQNCWKSLKTFQNFVKLFKIVIKLLKIVSKLFKITLRRHVPPPGTALAASLNPRHKLLIWRLKNMQKQTFRLFKKLLKRQKWRCRKLQMKLLLYFICFLWCFCLLNK